MTRRLIVLLVLRVLGILWAVGALAGLVELAVFSSGFDGESQDGGSAFPFGPASPWVFAGFLVRGSVALACLINTRWLARRLFPEFDDREIALPVQGLGKLAFQLMGVGTALGAAPSIFTAALELFWGLGGDRQRTFLALLENRWPGIVQSMVVALAGIAVYASAARLSGESGTLPHRTPQPNSDP
jgi:hypothetical protein